MACDGESWMDPWRVGQHWMFPAIQALSGKSYATLFPMSVLCLSLAVISLWLHFLEGWEMTPPNVPQRAQCCVFKRHQAFSCDSIGCPCRWKVKAVRVKDVLRLVSVLIPPLARGPGREKNRDPTILCSSKQALLTPSSTCLFVEWSPTLSHS